MSDGKDDTIEMTIFRCAGCRRAIGFCDPSDRHTQMALVLCGRCMYHPEEIIARLEGK